MKITTSDGYELNIRDEALDSYELLEALDEADNGHPGRLAGAFTMLLGKTQKNEFLEHYRNEQGVVPATKMFEVIQDIFATIKKTNEGKNSSSSQA